MRASIARWLSKRIGIEKDGLIRPPTSNLGIRLREPDESELVLLSEGDSFDLIAGKGEFTVIQVTPKTAMKLAWFILWRWWVLGTWMGWKTSAWNWCVDVHLEETELRRSEQRAKQQRAIQKRQGP